MTTPDPTAVSFGFLALVQHVRTQLRTMRMDVHVDDQPAREQLEAIVALNAARPVEDGARRYFASLLTDTIAELDKTIVETRADDFGMLAEAAFHDDDDADVLFDRMARRHGEDEADLRRQVEEDNDATRALMDAERD